MWKFSIENEYIIFEYVIQETVYMDKNFIATDKSNRNYRRLYLGDPDAHAARLKVFKNNTSKNRNDSISIGSDNGRISVMAGDPKKLNITPTELNMYYKIFEDNFDLLYYAFDNRKSINQNDINNAFIYDNNLRMSYDGIKEEGKLANPDVKRDRVTGNLTYVMYKNNPNNTLSPVRIVKDIKGNIVYETRPY